MPSEAQMWRDDIRPVLKAAKLDAHRIENLLGLGMPDVNYLHGWIELKYVKKWPKRDTTPLAIPHFTKEQRVWLLRRWRRGGHAWLLLKVEHEFFLFDGETAASYIGTGDHAGLINEARAYAGAFHSEIFIPHLVKPR